MTVAVPLVVYAAALAVAGPSLLRRIRWARKAPLLAMGIWLAACVSVIAAVVLAGLSLTLAGTRVSHDVAGLLHACAIALRDHYAIPWRPPAGPVGAGLAVAVALWASGHVAAVLIGGSRRRRAHAEALTLLASRDAELGADVVEHDLPAAYCLPGWRSRVVVTRGAVERLSPRELAAVLCHERAHVAQRHHLLIAVAEGLRAAYGFAPLFRAAASELAHLAELAADDAAARRQGRRTVATALLTVATGPVPASALGAAGPRVAERVLRMVAAPEPLARRTRLSGLTALHGLLTLPLLVASAPLVLAIIDFHCPLWH